MIRRIVGMAFEVGRDVARGVCGVPREELAIDRDTPLRDRELLSTERQEIEREAEERRRG